VQHRDGAVELRLRGRRARDGEVHAPVEVPGAAVTRMVGLREPGRWAEYEGAYTRPRRVSATASSSHHRVSHAGIYRSANRRTSTLCLFCG
jgi:hypothetical protein